MTRVNTLFIFLLILIDLIHGIDLMKLEYKVLMLEKHIEISSHIHKESK